MIIALLIATALGATAQTVTLPAVPPTLPRSVRSALDAERAAIVTRIDAFNASTDAFNARCGSVRVGTPQHAACGSDYAAMMAAQTALEGEKKAFAVRIAAALAVPCALIEGQLERDMDAMRRQQSTNQMGFNELEEWTKASQEAQRAAIKVGVTTLFGNVAKHLTSQERSARAFKGWLDRYEKQMRVKGVPFEALQEKIERATRGYVAARLQSIAGAGLEIPLGLAGAWEQLTTIGGAVATAQARSNADVKAALEDPVFKKFVNTEATGSDAVRAILDAAVEADASRALKKLVPGYGVLTFAVDYGYEATKWTAAYNRIVQQHKLADLQLQAVNALKLQIERTVKNLQACRASH